MLSSNSVATEGGTWIRKRICHLLCLKKRDQTGPATRRQLSTEAAGLGPCPRSLNPRLGAHFHSGCNLADLQKVLPEPFTML